VGQSETITFLFTDLVDSTRQMQTVGDETAHRLFAIHRKALSEAVAATGGEELEWLGDGMLASFSSAADAVRCAISMQQRARRPVAGAHFEIRIGINLGEVSRREGGYFGTPIVIARRLCDRASAGQILCSRLVGDILSGRHTFNFHDLEAFELKGHRSAGRHIRGYLQA
jgi:class 3 adenylate cyclase